GAFLDMLTSPQERPAILLATYFAEPVEALPVLAASGVEAIALDLIRGPSRPPELPRLPNKQLVLGAIDGRNVWRADLTESLSRLQRWRDAFGEVSVSTSCSLLHVPYSVNAEKELDP